MDHSMERSFNEFLQRPENRPILEAQQRKEVRQALRMQEKARALEFQEKVLESEYDAQKSIAPFLSSRALRLIIQTFTNDEFGDFSKWACNPLVLQMLAQAQQILREGRMSEDELEHALVAQLESADSKAAARPQTVGLPLEQLVAALNEHLAERQAGNELYRRGKHEEALQHYQAAAAIVEFVRGHGAAEQAEINANRLAVYLNAAAAHLALQQFADARAQCSKALELDPINMKALLRRANAHIGMHDYANARADLKEAEKHCKDCAALQTLQVKLKVTIEAGILAEKKAFLGRM